jgi:hypothetical protein
MSVLRATSSVETGPVRRALPCRGPGRQERATAPIPAAWRTALASDERSRSRTGIEGFIRERDVEHTELAAGGVSRTSCGDGTLIHVHTGDAGMQIAGEQLGDPTGPTCDLEHGRHIGPEPRGEFARLRGLEPADLPEILIEGFETNAAMRIGLDRGILLLEEVGSLGQSGTLHPCSGPHLPGLLPTQPPDPGRRGDGKTVIPTSRGSFRRSVYGAMNRPQLRVSTQTVSQERSGSYKCSLRPRDSSWIFPTAEGSSIPDGLLEPCPTR